MAAMMQCADAFARNQPPILRNSNATASRLATDKQGSYRQQWRQIPCHSILMSTLVAMLVVLAFPLSLISDDRPNVILINLDDADQAILDDRELNRRFPSINRLRNEGIRFTNFHVTTPLCGPSRACLLRGQYASNLGILVNSPTHEFSRGFDGGFPVYLANGYIHDDIGTRMLGAGYRTMLVGKYLHPDFIRVTPTGWSDFYVSQSARYHGTPRWVSEDGSELTFQGTDNSDYRTDVESTDIQSLIIRHFDRDEERSPFFLYWAPIAPHLGAGEDPIDDMIDHVQYDRLWSNVRLPRTYDLNEEDVSDKHPLIQEIQAYAEWQIDNSLTRYYRARLVSLKSVDDAIAQLLATLDFVGESNNTYIMLCSDNGFQLGHHRLLGKKAPFDRNTNVPLICWGPGIPAGSTAHHLLAHIDVMPTILDIAGTRTPSYVDGHSFFELLEEPFQHDESTWQAAVLIENWEAMAHVTLNENLNTTYSALRFYDEVYTEWSDGFREYYDLARDPRQLRNRWSSLDQSQQDALHSLLISFPKGQHEPRIVIESPGNHALEPSHAVMLRGVASVDSGVRRVRLQIQDETTSKYWDGSKWSSQSNWVYADIHNDGLQANWSYIIEQPSFDEGIWPLTVKARVVDQDGDRNELDPQTRFFVDAMPPDASITFPEANAIYTDDIEIQGLVVDEHSVKRVTIVIRKTTNGRYFNGQSFQEEWAGVITEADESGNFRLPFTLNPGSYSVTIRAIDDSGNISPPITPIPFRMREP